MLNKSRKRKLGGTLFDVLDDLEVNSLVVHSTALFEGNVTMLQALYLNGGIEIGGDITVDGNATVKGDLTVQGSSTFEEATFNGTLNVGTSGDKENLVVEGESRLKGRVDVENEIIVTGAADKFLLKFDNGAEGKPTAKVQASGALDLIAGLEAHMMTQRAFAWTIETGVSTVTTGAWTQVSGAYSLTGESISLNCPTGQLTIDAGNATIGTFAVEWEALGAWLLTAANPDPLIIPIIAMTAEGAIFLTAGAGMTFTSGLEESHEVLQFSVSSTNVLDPLLDVVDVQTIMGALSFVTGEGNIKIRTDDGEIQLTGVLKINGSSVDDLEFRKPFKVLASPPTMTTGTVYLDNGTNTDTGLAGLRISTGGAIFEDILNTTLVKYRFLEQSTVPSVAAGMVYLDDGTETYTTVPGIRVYTPVEGWRELAFLKGPAEFDDTEIIGTLDVTSKTTFGEDGTRFTATALVPDLLVGAMYYDDGNGTWNSEAALRQYIGSTWYELAYIDRPTRFTDTEVDGTLDISGVVTIGTRTGNPVGPATGAMYFNTSAGRLYMYDGSAWQTTVIQGDDDGILFEPLSTAPSPSDGVVYYDDGTNTWNTEPGLLQYVTSAWYELAFIDRPARFTNTYIDGTLTMAGQTVLDEDGFRFEPTSTAPTSTNGVLYYDDGTNTSTTNAGLRIAHADAHAGFPWADIPLYQQGTWTPLITNSTGSQTFGGFTAQEGVWIRFGNAVFLQMFIAWGNRGSVTAGSPIYINGNPVEGNSYFTRQGMPIYLMTLVGGGTATLTHQLQSANNTTRLTITENNYGSGTGAYANVLSTDVGVAGVIQANGWWVTENNKNFPY